MVANTTRDVPKLTTTRINRLLRPLRTRCLAFAIASGDPLRHRGQGAQSKKRRVAPRPMTALSATEITQKAHDVRGAFENIILNTRQVPPQTTGSRIPNLSSLCSTVVGENMQAFNLGCGQDEDDEYATNVTDELYDAIPEAVRRSAVLAHALQIVLDICTSHPFLSNILYGITLRHNLLCETDKLLRSILSRALPSPSSSESADRRPTMPSILLTDLHGQWCKHGRSHESFINILLEAIFSSSAVDIWISSVVVDLCRSIREKSPSAFVRLVAEYALLILTPQFQRKIGKAPCKFGDNEQDVLNAHHAQLNRWIELVFVDHLNHPYDILTYANLRETILHLLLTVLDARKRYRALRLDSYVEDAIICLATTWLSKPSDSDWGTGIDRLLSHLKAHEPLPSTYELLLSSLSFTASLDNFQDKLQLFSATLRHHGLDRLEASMWRCALRSLEDHKHRRRTTATDGDQCVERYRRELIVLMDEVEDRCFASKNAGTDGDDSGSCNGWSWESGLQTWFKAFDGSLETRKRKGEDGDLDEENNVRVLRRRTRSPRHSACGNRPKKGRSQDGGRPPRVSNNFQSLLSDAFSRRKTLHAEALKHEEDWQDGCEFVQDQDPFRRSSDDLLDLFALDDV